MGQSRAGQGWLCQCVEGQEEDVWMGGLSPLRSKVGQGMGREEVIWPLPCPGW